MDIKKIIKRTFNSTCIIFTVITAVYMLILQIINMTKISASVEAHRVLLFFIFSLLLSCANTILTIDKLHSAARYICIYKNRILKEARRPRDKAPECPRK